MSKQDNVICKKLRKKIFITGFAGGMAHLASCYSAVEIIYSLYMKDIMKYDPNQPTLPDRDRFILSKGHAGLALFAVMVEAGMLAEDEFDGYLKKNSRIGGEPCMRDIPGIEATTGSLGHGLSMGIGMALGQKLNGYHAKTFVLLGDGECQEGTVWEALLLAPAFHLNNLVVILDANQIQKMDTIENIIGISNWRKRIEPLGWNVKEVDGHDVDAIVSCLKEDNLHENPVFIIAHTVKGKGVSIMEGNPIWHFKLPNRKEKKNLHAGIGYYRGGNDCVMQSIYISRLMQLAEKDKRILHLVADSGTGYDEMFRHNFPKQIFNFGIAEENMVAAAAGLATTGYIPFVYTSGAFLVYRALEFIRDDICFQNLNVKIVGMGSGLSWSSLGPTHHTTEEVSVLRAIPGIKILSPATPYEVGACLELAYNYTGPVYIRIGMNHEKEFFEERHAIDFGKNEIISEGCDVTIFSTGSILGEVVSAHILNDKGISTGVVNVVSIKPFDASNIIELSKRTKYLATVEEHNIIGGLSSIIADTLVDNRIDIPLIRIGLCDKFAEGYGTLANVREANKLDCYSIVQKIMEEMK